MPSDALRAQLEKLKYKPLTEQSIVALILHITDLFAGALLVSNPSSLLIANCTFANNRASNAGGLYLSEAQTGNNRVVNSIFAENTGQYGSQICLER